MPVSMWIGRWCLWSGYLFFFFQAEDGIRDYKVTGVQTCALPILRICSTILGVALSSMAWNASALSLGSPRGNVVLGAPFDLVVGLQPDSGNDAEIGRASCRERV